MRENLIFEQNKNFARKKKTAELKEKILQNLKSSDVVQV